jgi:hypothetical protein
MGESEQHRGLWTALLLTILGVVLGLMTNWFGLSDLRLLGSRDDKTVPEGPITTFTNSLPASTSAPPEDVTTTSTLSTTTTDIVVPGVRSFSDVTADMCSSVLNQPEIEQLTGRSIPPGHETGTRESRTCAYVGVDGDDRGVGLTCHNRLRRPDVFSDFEENGVVQSGTDPVRGLAWHTNRSAQFVFGSATAVCVVWSVDPEQTITTDVLTALTDRLYE